MTVFAIPCMEDWNETVPHSEDWTQTVPCMEDGNETMMWVYVPALPGPGHTGDSIGLE